MWLSYRNQAGYVWFMAKLQIPADFGLRPGSCRLVQFVSPPRCRHHRSARRRVVDGRRQRSWQPGFIHGFAQGGLDVALEQSGLTDGEALLACLDDPTFRVRLDRISAERLAACERRLVDILWRRLNGPDEGIEKSVLAVWQCLSDEKRRVAARLDPQPSVPPARKARRGIPSGRAETAHKAAKEAEEFHQLLEVIRKRLAAAEQTATDS